LRRQILTWVGVVLFGFGATLLGVPVDGTDEGRECGDTPAAVAALGIDTAAPSDGAWCRSKARSEVVGGVLVFMLPGALLLWRQWWRWRGVEVVDAPPPLGSPKGVQPPSSAPPLDAGPGASVSPGLVPGLPTDLYLSPQRAVVVLLFALCFFWFLPLAWVAGRAGRLGLQRRSAMTLDDAGLTDHRFGIVLPWSLVHGVRLVGGTAGHMAVEVGEFWPRPGWRPGAAMRWLALQLVRSRGELRLSVWGLEGVEAFVSEASSRAHPRMTGQLPDRLVLYRWSWWLLGIPASAALAVLLLRMYLSAEGLPAGGLVLIPAAVWLLWRGLGAVRARPLLVVDRDGMTISRRPTFHATWDEVSSMEFLPGGQHGKNQLLVRLHATPAERTVDLDGLSAPAQEIAEVAERLYARHRDGTITDSSQTIGSRPSRLVAAGAIAVALIVGGVGWYTRPSGGFSSGDCYRHSGAYQVRWAPCDEPHDGEILVVLEHPADDSTKHPGNGALHNWAAPRCDAAFASYVGRPERADDELTYQMWRPELQAWAEGDRTIVCVVANETGAILEDRVKA
jgi:hypothetical protein